MSTPATIYPNPIYAVYAKDLWSDPWGDPIPNWEPQSVQVVAAPSISHAKIKLCFGDIKRQNAVVFAQEVLPDKKARFIKITVQTNGASGPAQTLFIGYSPVEDVKQFPFDGGGEDTGDWELTAYGLEYLLDNVTMDGAWCDPDMMADEGAEAVFITRSLAFNQKDAYGFLGVGNRTAEKWSSLRPSGAESYVFNLDYDPADPPDPDDPDTTWNAQDICEYALVRFGASDNYATGIEFVLGGQADALANWKPPRLDVSGKTVRQVLNHLIDRRRGVGYSIIWDANDQPIVHVFTAVAANVVSNGFIIPANAEAAELDLSSDIRVDKDVSLTTDLNTRFGRIEVHGAPIKVTFTIDFDDAGQTGLKEGWKDALETDYLAADDAARSADKYAPVYQLFVVGTEFDWKTEATVGCFNDGSVEPTSVSPIRRWGRVFERQLTIYDDNKDLRKPMVLAKPRSEPDAPPNPNDDKYFFVEKPPIEPGKTNYSCHVCLMDDNPGFELRSTGLNHVMANGIFTADDSTAQPSEIAPVFDYRSLKATMCVAIDEILSVSLTIPTGDIDRLLVIHMPHAQTWVVAAGTVTDIDADGALVTQDTAEITRDDKASLQAIGAMAQAWYSFPRSALSFGYDGINLGIAKVGALATGVKLGASDNNVNSPCTMASWDCVRGKSHFSFAWEELDFAAIGGFQP